MKISNRIFTLALVSTIAGLAGAGCSSVKYGGIRPNSQFVYPNSNVTPLGPTQVTKSRTWFFLRPSLSFEQVRGTYNQALAQVPGANLLIDYKEDTTVSSYFFFNTVSYTLDGTAAKMEVGKKELSQ